MCSILFFIYFLLSIICGPGTHYDSCGNLSLSKPPNCSRYEVSCRYFQSWTKGSMWETPWIQCWEHGNPVHPRITGRKYITSMSMCNCLSCCSNSILIVTDFPTWATILFFFPKYENDVMFHSSERLHTWLLSYFRMRWMYLSGYYWLSSHIFKQGLLSNIYIHSIYTFLFFQPQYMRK